MAPNVKVTQVNDAHPGGSTLIEATPTRREIRS
jgi:hypothetical protein